MATGVVGFIFGIIAFALVLVTSLGVPTLIVLALLHVGPFARSAPSDNSAKFCSTLNVMNNYSASHHSLATEAEVLTSLEYSHNKLVSARGVPTSIAGTVTATISTTHKLITLIQVGINNGGLSASQRSHAVVLDGVFNDEGSTMNRWFQSNC